MKDHLESPCGRFGVSIEPSKRTGRYGEGDLYVAEHYTECLFSAWWHRNGYFCELHIDFDTALEFNPEVEDLEPSDYLQGVEYEAAITYNNELRNFLPPPMFKELGRLLRAYRMGLL